MRLVAPLVMMGLAAYYTTTAIRHLTPFRDWAARGIKPFACDLCMSFWTAMLWSTGFHMAGFDSTLVKLPELSRSWSYCFAWALWTASVGAIAYMLLRKAGEPPPLPNFIEPESSRRLRAIRGGEE